MIVGFMSFMVDAVPRMEGRFIQLQNTYTTPVWTQVNFQQTYDAPPAVFMLSTNQGGNPAIIRIRNVTTTGFEALPLEPSGEDGEHITMGAHYFAVETGIHAFDDGTILEVGKVNINNLQYGTTNYGGGRDFVVPRSWHTLNFVTNFSQTPTFFHSLQTINNLDSVVPQTALVPFYTVAANNLNSTSIQLALDASETIRGSSSLAETIAYMAVEPGNNRTFTDDDGNIVTWETLFSGSIIDGWSDGCNNVFFQNTYTNAPLVAASKVTRNGSDGGWLRSCRLDNRRLGLVVDEDRSWDSERNHSFENASVLAMDRSRFVFSGEFPSCDEVFPGAVASYTSSELVFPDIGKVELNGFTRIIDNNGAIVTTQNLQTTGSVTCNGSPCGQSSSDAISAPTADLIPSLVNDGSTNTLPQTLSGNYFMREQLVLMNQAYSIVSPTRIFIQSPGSGIEPLLQIVSPTFNINPGASLTIYVDGNVSISAGSNTEGFILSTGIVVIGSGVTHNGRITAGDYIRAESFGTDTTEVNALLGAELPTYIPGICGVEVVETIDHYRFELPDNQGLTCEAKSFSVKACANADCSQTYSQTTSLDLSPNNSGQYTWSPAENINFIGQVDVSLAKISEGNASLGYNLATPSAPLQCYIGGQLISGDCRIRFKDSGFVFSNVSGGNIDDQIAAVGFEAYLRAVRKNSTTGACESIFTGNQTVVFDNSFISPATPSAEPGMLLLINGNVVSGDTPISVNFDATDNNRAKLNVNYTDSGSITLQASKTVDTGASVSGSSNSFVVRPERFNITVTGDPNASDAEDSVFKMASEDFTIQVEAHNANGAITRNFRSADITGTVALTHNLQVPQAGTPGALSPSTVPSNGFISGVANLANVKFNEVGIITINASLLASNYLNHSGGGSITGEKSNIGRFIPAQFEMTEQTLKSGCNSFTYYSQPFDELSYTITAQDVLGNRLRNYTYNANSSLNFARASIENLIENDDAANYKSATQLASRYSLSADDGTEWQQGLYVVNVNNATLERDSAPSIPMTQVMPLVRLTDQDGKALNDLNQNADRVLGVADSRAIGTVVIGGVEVISVMEMRYGRLTLSNNYGSEYEPLQIPMKVEYWDGTNFVVNTSDSCSTYNFANLVIEDNQPLEDDWSDSFAAGIYKSGRELFLTAPTPTEQRTYNVDYVSPEKWLQFDWNNDGNYNDVNDNPNAVLQFGRFRGNDRVIYWREN
ncbi:agglutinin biogenesis protein MshQ [Pseudoalteromonas spongiae]|nr:agglutinin biogenesis protein MshQ [Pseudoalteromonas spongiae]